MTKSLKFRFKILNKRLYQIENDPLNFEQFLEKSNKIILLK